MKRHPQFFCYWTGYQAANVARLNLKGKSPTDEKVRAIFSQTSYRSRRGYGTSLKSWIGKRKEKLKIKGLKWKV